MKIDTDRQKMLGWTLKETRHGAYGCQGTLPAGIWVRLTYANNLPDDSPIKWWASPIDGCPWPAAAVSLAESIGVGLYADDVDHGQEEKEDSA